MKLDIHGSVHQDMVYLNDQKDSAVWYNLRIVPWLLYMFRTILSLTIRSFYTVFLKLLVIRTLLPADVVGESESEQFWFSHDTGRQWRTYVLPVAVKIQFRSYW